MEEEFISKSQKKREAKTLQDLGVALVALSETKLDSLALPERLLQAILDAKQISSHGAKKRQELWIGKLLRAADSEAILESYDQLLQENSAQSAHFHQIEHWRDKLLEDPASLTEFIDLYKPDDIQHLRQLIKKALQAVEVQQKTAAVKALFRYIRSCIT